MHIITRNENGRLHEAEELGNGICSLGRWPPAGSASNRPSAWLEWIDDFSSSVHLFIFHAAHFSGHWAELILHSLRCWNAYTSVNGADGKVSLLWCFKALPEGNSWVQLQRWCSILGSGYCIFKKLPLVCGFSLFSFLAHQILTLSLTNPLCTVTFNNRLGCTGVQSKASSSFRQLEKDYVVRYGFQSDKMPKLVEVSVE